MKAIILICLVAVTLAAVNETRTFPKANVTVNETEIAHQKSIIKGAATEAAKKANERRTEIEAAFEKRIALEAELAVKRKHKQETELNLKNALKFLKKQGKTVKAIQGKLRALWKKTTAVAKNVTAKAVNKTKEITKKALNTTTGQKLVNLTHQAVNATKAALNTTTGQKVVNATHAAVNVTKGWASRAGSFLRHAANATKNALNHTVEAVKHSNTTHAIVNATKSALNATKTAVNTTIHNVKNSNTTHKIVNATKKAINATVTKVNATVHTVLNSTVAHKIANATKHAMNQTEVLIAKLKTQLKATAERIHLEDKLKVAVELQAETLDKVEAYLTDLKTTNSAVKKLEKLVKAAKEHAHKLISESH